MWNLSWNKTWGKRVEPVVKINPGYSEGNDRAEFSSKAGATSQS